MATNAVLATASQVLVADPTADAFVLQPFASVTSLASTCLQYWRPEEPSSRPAWLDGCSNGVCSGLSNFTTAQRASFNGGRSVVFRLKFVATGQFLQVATIAEEQAAVVTLATNAAQAGTTTGTVAPAAGSGTKLLSLTSTEADGTLFLTGATLNNILSAGAQGQTVNGTACNPAAAPCFFSGSPNPELPDPALVALMAPLEGNDAHLMVLATGVGIPMAAPASAGNPAVSVTVQLPVLGVPVLPFGCPADTTSPASCVCQTSLTNVEDASKGAKELWYTSTGVSTPWYTACSSGGSAALTFGFWAKSLVPNSTSTTPVIPSAARIVTLQAAPHVTCTMPPTTKSASKATPTASAGSSTATKVRDYVLYIGGGIGAVLLLVAVGLVIAVARAHRTAKKQAPPTLPHAAVETGYTPPST